MGSGDPLTPDVLARWARPRWQAGNENDPDFNNAHLELRRTRG